MAQPFSIGFSSRGLRFGPHPHGGSQTSVTPVPLDPTSPSDLLWEQLPTWCTYVYACSQNTHTHINLFFKKGKRRAQWLTTLTLHSGRQKQVDVGGRGQPGLQNEFQDYIFKPCLKKTNKGKKKPYKITTKTKKWGKQPGIVANSEIITGATWRRSMGR